MYCKTTALLLICVILCFCCQLLAKPTDSADANNVSSVLFSQFCTQTGFKGDYVPAEDGRIFTKLSGTFNLPVPRDSVALHASMGKIANDLNVIYQKQGANFTLKPINYDDKSKSCQYIQYWKRFYLVHQPYYLLITYHPETDTYSIHNTLYMKPITITDKVVSLETIKATFNIVIDPNNRKSDFSSVKQTYALTDTASIHGDLFFNNQRDYYHYFLTLNLFPDKPDDANSSFSLQWKCSNTDYPRTVYCINAATGELRGEAQKLWQENIPLIKAANNFIKIAKLSEKSSFKIDYGRIDFSDIEVTLNVRDTTEFRQVSDYYITCLQQMYKQLGFDFQTEYLYTQLRGAEYESYDKEYVSTYIQSFKYQLPYDTSRLHTEIYYNTTQHTLWISPQVWTKPVIYSKEVVSPVSILENYIRYEQDYYKEESQKSGTVAYKYVSASTILHNNCYYDRAHSLKARLCVIPIMGGGGGEELTDVKTGWVVRSIDEQSRQKYYDEFTGISLFGDDRDDSDYEKIWKDADKLKPDPKETKAIEEAFTPIGFTGDYRVDPGTNKVYSFNAYLNLTTPADSVQLLANCYAINACLLQLFKLNPKDYSWNLRQNEYENGISAYLCYKTYEIKGITNTDVNIVSYDPDENKYHISYNLLPYLNYDFEKSLPACVLTPQTILDIITYRLERNLITHEDSLFFHYTELDNLSGEFNYFTDFASQYLHDDYTYLNGPLILRFAPFKVKDSDIYKYRLVWELNPYYIDNTCDYYSIDVVTGKILQVEVFD